MHQTKRCLYAICLLSVGSAQTRQQTKSIATGPTSPTHVSSATLPPMQIEPVILSRVALDDKIVTLQLIPRIATSIRLPEPVNSVVLGDPVNFEAEHSDHEPDLVTVKPVGSTAAQTNLLITTTTGHQANLLLISPGGDVSGTRHVDVLLKYGKPVTGSFLIDEAPLVSSIVAETRKLNAGSAERTATASSSAMVPAVIHDDRGDPKEGSPGSTGGVLDRLLARQQQAPTPALYGQRQSDIETGPRVQAGVSEVLDEGNQVAVLFSVVNPSEHAIEILPPQVQLGGKLKKKWTTAEQLRVVDFRLGTLRIGPGQRTDGVALFERPAFKQSNETLFLQIADSGAVDKPALAPIGFGISSIRGGSAYGNR